MNDNVALLQRIFESGTVDTESQDKLFECFARWMYSGGDLTFFEAFQIGQTDLECRRTLRDRWLCEAAEQLPGTPWQKAKSLRDLAQHFERRQWLAWKASAHPPAHAGPVMRGVFYALKTGLMLPGSIQGYEKVLTRTG